VQENNRGGRAASFVKETVLRKRSKTAQRAPTARLKGRRLYRGWMIAGNRCRVSKYAMNGLNSAEAEPLRLRDPLHTRRRPPIRNNSRIAAANRGFVIDARRMDPIASRKRLSPEESIQAGSRPERFRHRDGAAA